MPVDAGFLLEVSVQGKKRETAVSKMAERERDPYLLVILTSFFCISFS